VRQTRETRIVARISGGQCRIWDGHIYDFETIVKRPSANYSEIEPAWAAAWAGDRE
jgi:hypothetical protein